LADVEYIRPIVEKVSRYWDAKKRAAAEKILKALEEMDEEKAAKVVKKEVEMFIESEAKIKKCLDQGKSMRECGNPVKLLVEWLDSPSGIIAYSFMWKPRFAEKMVKLISTTLVLGERIAHSFFSK